MQTSEENLNDYIRKQREQQELALQKAYECQDQKDRQHIAKAKLRPLTKFPINSYVLSHNEANDGRPPHKLAPKLRVPFRILNSTYRPQETIYTCEKLATGKVEDFHVKLLIEYHFHAYHHNRTV